MDILRSNPSTNGGLSHLGRLSRRSSGGSSSERSAGQNRGDRASHGCTTLVTTCTFVLVQGFFVVAVGFFEVLRKQFRCKRNSGVGVEHLLSSQTMHRSNLRNSQTELLTARRDCTRVERRLSTDQSLKYHWVNTVGLCRLSHQVIVVSLGGVVLLGCGNAGLRLGLRDHLTAALTTIVNRRRSAVHNCFGLRTLLLLGFDLPKVCQPYSVNLRDLIG